MTETWALWAGSPWLFTATMTGLGLLVGSFLNVVIHRLPVMMERAWRADCAALDNASPPTDEQTFNLMVPRSRCPSCGIPIAGYDNIPVLSFLLLRGRCRACRAPIAFRYPMIEAVSGALAAFTALHFGPGWACAWALLLGWSLIALAGIDFDTQYLPDQITQPMLWLGLLVNSRDVFVELHTALLGAVVGYLSLWSVYWLFKLLTGKEGMGYGDFKLLAMLGAWLGWQCVPIIIFGSSLVGAAVGLTLIAFKNHARQTPIPFGPYLAAAGLIALFWGDRLLALWLRPGGGL